MKISVFSEIGQLREVLLHRPGRELEGLTPPHLSRMLFDDIPFLKGAQQEHDAFAQALTEGGARVRYLTDLASETLEIPEAKEHFIREFIHKSGDEARYEQEALFALLRSLSPRELVEKTMAGITYKDAGIMGMHPLTRLTRQETRYLSDPIPNLYFTRDPFSVIGRGVAYSRMYAAARRRETLYGQTIFAFHPEFQNRPPAFYGPELPFSLEGGDILYLGRGVLGVGLSQRTQTEAIEALCHNLSKNPESGINTVLVIDIPNVRAFMHLDTVFTQVDRGAFVVHPGILNVLRCYRVRVDKGNLKATQLSSNLQEALQEELQEEKITLIPCGGEDLVAAEREQWNDGSNTLAISPGKVVTYDRNTITNRILADHGIQVVQIPGSELGRGRGGPRCMSMPLLRDDID